MNAASLLSAHQGPAAQPHLARAADGDLAAARELKQAFSQFVGETFFGEMLKSMRGATSEPAYFHGGFAEDQFQSQLDASLASDLGGANGSGFADDLFEHQFPEEAALLREATAGLQANKPQATNAQTATDATAALSQLNALRRPQ